MEPITDDDLQPLLPLPPHRGRYSVSPPRHDTSRRRRRRSTSSPSRSTSVESGRGSRHRYNKRRRSRSRGRSPSRTRSPSGDRSSKERKRNSQAGVEDDTNGSRAELKIKGSASIKSTSKRKPLGDRLAEEEASSPFVPHSQEALTAWQALSQSNQKKERELKEAALRSKLIKSKARKSSLTGEE